MKLLLNFKESPLPHGLKLQVLMEEEEVEAAKMVMEKVIITFGL
jgi:hypothetical protein